MTFVPCSNGLQSHCSNTCRHWCSDSLPQKTAGKLKHNVIWTTTRRTILEPCNQYLHPLNPTKGANLQTHGSYSQHRGLHGGKHVPEVMAKGQHVPNFQRDHETYPEKSSYCFRRFQTLSSPALHSLFTPSASGSLAILVHNFRNPFSERSSYEASETPMDPYEAQTLTTNQSLVDSKCELSISTLVCFQLPPMLF